MKLKIPIILSLFFYCIQVAAQDVLYTPRNVQYAVEKGTRSLDGKPGKHYWQNKGIYNISIAANPPNQNIAGEESITYINNSPDSLKSLLIRLVENIHKTGTGRYSDAGTDYLTEGVTIDAVTIDGKPAKWDDDAGKATWKFLALTTPLAPNSKVALTFKWHYPLSYSGNREGKIDSTSYFLAYFYPRVAVYDDYNGWDMTDFTDLQEFYNDFNDYTLEVKVPQHYLVWATGDLQNANEVLQPSIATRLNQSYTSDTVIHIATQKELAAGKVTADLKYTIWKWKATDISDITLALSNHFVWDAASVVVDDATGRRASVQSAYNDTAKDYHSMVAFGVHSLDWFSHNLPGVPYPFPKTTIVQGHGDMEYPMMVNDATNDDTLFSRFVVEHEIAHSWFPFYMGINENRYPFMDEGWATTFELFIGREDLGIKTADNFYKRFRVNRWIHDLSQEQDLPIITPANILNGPGYGNNAYGKPSLGYLAVKDILGDDLFKKSLQEYMLRWHGKHPTPWDFFYSMNDASGTNLNWFWTNWYFSNGYIDLAITNTKKVRGGYEVQLKNVGGFAAPVNLILDYTDGSTETLHQTPLIWEKNLKQATIKVSTKKELSRIVLDGGIFMDANLVDNIWNVDK